MGYRIIWMGKKTPDARLNKLFLSYEKARQALRRWFRQPEVRKVAEHVAFTNNDASNANYRLLGFRIVPCKS